MTAHADFRGATPVGRLIDLGPTEAGAIVHLRLLHAGQAGRDLMRGEMCQILGPDAGGRMFGDFKDLCALIGEHGRRPLLHHSVGCDCVGADEAKFALIFGHLADADQEEALMTALLLVRADIAPGLVALAARIAMDYRRMALRAVARRMH